MRRKLDVTYDDMMQLRLKGYSNKDIANMLEISVPTVRRYIGKQGCHMESVTRTPDRCGITKPRVETEVKVMRQIVAVNGYGFDLNMDEKSMVVKLPDIRGEFYIHVSEVEKFKAALDAVVNLMNAEVTV